MVMQRDPNDWLRRFSPAEWIRAGLAEVRRAEQAYARHDGRGGLAGCKRAAGMALNGILWFEEKEEWGRSYVDHLHGLAKDADAPEAVRQACAKLLGSPAPSDSAASAAQGPLVTLRSPRQDQSVIEATKDILAHAYAVVQRHGGGELP